MILKSSMKERKWLVGVTAFALAAILAGAAPALVEAAPPVGSPAPDFALEDIYGTSHTLSDYAGKIVVLAFLSHT